MLGVVVVKPILINGSVAQTCFEISGCLKSADGVRIEIERVGGGEFIVTYPALLVDDGRVCFAWDYVLWGAPVGRYVGRIYGLGDDVVCVALEVVGGYDVVGAENVLSRCQGC